MYAGSVSSLYRTTMPAPLDEAVMRGLAYRAGDRWATAAEMNARLKPVLDAVDQMVADKAAAASKRLASAKTEIVR